MSKLQVGPEWKARAILVGVCVAVFGSLPNTARCSQTLQTRYARIRIDDKGFITSIVSRSSGKNYSPAGHPSPLLSLHEPGRTLFPVSAAFLANKREIKLKYPNGAIATVKVAAKKTYFRFQLVSLAPRGTVDNIVWGPVHTTISKIIGDLIGVVRDGRFAIGMMGLNDNTISGPPVDGDCYEMGYYIHSPDPAKYPVPPEYKEGEHFSVGGNGSSDVAFYSHPEEYFQQVFGTGAVLEPSYGSTLACHSRDRRKTYTYLFSLLPDFEGSRPRHQVTDPVNVDFMGSAVALYACPDKLGLSVIDGIILAEGLPHPMLGGKWVRDPTGFKPDIAWEGGPHDKLIEYADALGIKGVQDEGQGEYFANPADHWLGKRVELSGGRRVTYKQFTDDANKHGIRYGLHTLCLFLQPRVCSDVTPVPSRHLQTVLRTKLANDISSTSRYITVTDPSFLAEHGTWPNGDVSNVLRIGTELLTYTGISDSVPYTLLGVRRGQFLTRGQPHRAGAALVKLQMNCYNGFCPDMKLMPKYADYYADVMHENGMRYIDFDGLESTLYQNQGYYGVRVFFRRFFKTYARLTGGKCPRVMGSCVFPGSWEYMSVCNVGGGVRMFDPIHNKWGIEGKDIRDALSNSYFPATFGIQDLRSDWSVYDAENLEAKSIGWNATYMLGLSVRAVDRCGDRKAIFKAIRTWENARAENVFTAAAKKQLRNLHFKFHLKQTGNGKFILYPVREVRFMETRGNDAGRVSVLNPYKSQRLQFALHALGPADGCAISLPDGRQIKSNLKISKGEFILCTGDHAYLADQFRNKIADLPMEHAAVLPKGDSKMAVSFPGEAATPFALTVWMSGRGEPLGK